MKLPKGKRGSVFGAEWAKATGLDDGNGEPQNSSQKPMTAGKDRHEIMTTAAQQVLRHQHRSDQNWTLRTYQRGFKRYVSHCVDCGQSLTRQSKPARKRTHSRSEV
jgi:hypothetical protein